MKLLKWVENEWIKSVFRVGDLAGDLERVTAARFAGHTLWKADFFFMFHRFRSREGVSGEEADAIIW